MIRRYLQKYFAKLLYSTRAENWYLSKGYLGDNEQECFASFLMAQRQKGALFYEEFKSIHHISRQFIKSGNEKLDTVLLIPGKSGAPGKSERDLYFIFFQGRGEFYEGRFRDMAIQARETGAAVLGFNPKGFKSSTGSTKKITDIVDDGIAVIKYLLDQKNLLPSQIILQGNSLGAAVQEMVNEHFRKLYRFRFRQINSNSFSLLSTVLAHQYNIPYFEKIIKSILLYADWELIPGVDFYQTGVYRCHLRRFNDRTLSAATEYHAKINIEKDCALCPPEYSNVNRWLYNNCRIVYRGSNEQDPHFLSLNLFSLEYAGGKNKHSVYELINIYINESQKYI